LDLPMPPRPVAAIAAVAELPNSNAPASSFSSFARPTNSGLWRNGMREPGGSAAISGMLSRGMAATSGLGMAGDTPSSG
jgi:hypothetical protein